ncbi:hypothetical protein DOY81_015331, partial [Sarcophaga bullata]
MTPAADPEPPRQCPLPALSWANAHDVWQLMCKKDEQAACLRDCNMLDHHPGLQPRMRAILLDWLIELHRENLLLAVDYLDREFAYVTDGGLQESIFMQHEIITIASFRGWISKPVTASWLVGANLSAPSDAATRNCKVDDAFIYPQFSGLEFVQTAQLLDLCSLDVGVGNFPYSVIAAAAISHTFN